MSSAYNFAALQEALARVQQQPLPPVAPVGLNLNAFPANQQLLAQMAFNTNFQYWNSYYQSWFFQNFNWSIMSTVPVFQPPPPVMPQLLPATMSNVLQSQLFAWPPPPSPPQQTNNNGTGSSNNQSGSWNGSFKMYREKRHTYTNAELDHLIRAYNKNSHPAPDVYRLLEIKTGLPAHKIKVWFATRRRRDKRRENAAATN